ncbi:terminus macrodomain insulation protein YfbV [Thalassotalea mangrovi]|uniref:UPF0208 membrane protein YfbV n=1 Tax=Thalassotalea mangrovi TaxID=2572245 RepID=A0A4U1B3E4_9GAMM|nr:terminus macrodomain insulation protein YfbV [Thalassotalea mangrovi]TKB44353.1 DUF412 domain-containing protein [Thalassotalea mangrovi]
MKSSLIQQLKLGNEYVNLWPERVELSRYFAQYQAVVACRFSKKYCLPLALLVLFVPIMAYGSAYLNTTSVYALFIASLPAQALLFMAKQSKQSLPPSLASWYKQGVERIQQHGASSPDVKFTLTKPSFMDLAKLLDYSYRTMKH